MNYTLGRFASSTVLFPFWFICYHSMNCLLCSTRISSAISDIFKIIKFIDQFFIRFHWVVFRYFKKISQLAYMEWNELKILKKSDNWMACFTQIWVVNYRISIAIYFSVKQYSQYDEYVTLFQKYRYGSWCDR